MSDQIGSANPALLTGCSGVTCESAQNRIQADDVDKDDGATGGGIEGPSPERRPRATTAVAYLDAVGVRLGRDEQLPEGRAGWRSSRPSASGTRCEPCWPPTTRARPARDGLRADARHPGRGRRWRRDLRSRPARGVPGSAGQADASSASTSASASAARP